jgi:hypothetical protein
MCRVAKRNRLCYYGYKPLQNGVNLVQSAVSDNLRLAVLIDADNAPRDCLKSVMEEAAIYGTPTVKRIYGDWTNPTIGGWKASL